MLWRVRVACSCGSASPTQLCSLSLRVGLPAQRVRRLPLSLPLPLRPLWEVRPLLRRVPQWWVSLLQLLLLLLLLLLLEHWGEALPLRWRLPRLPYPAPVGAPLRPELAVAERLGCAAGWPWCACTEAGLPGPGVPALCREQPTLAVGGVVAALRAQRAQRGPALPSAADSHPPHSFLSSSFLSLPSILLPPPCISFTHGGSGVGQRQRPRAPTGL